MAASRYNPPPERTCRADGCEKWAKRGGTHCEIHDPARRLCAYRLAGGSPCTQTAKNGQHYCGHHPEGAPLVRFRRDGSQVVPKSHLRIKPLVYYVLMYQERGEWARWDREEIDTLEGGRAYLASELERYPRTLRLVRVTESFQVVTDG